MGNSPAPFSNIGRKARDLLARDYYFDQMFSLTMLSGTGMGLTTTGVKKNQFFFGEIRSQYKGRRTIVDVKVNTSSNISTVVAVKEVFPGIGVVLSFKIPDHKSGNLDVWYRHARAAIYSSIGLNPTPLLEFLAAVGTKQITLGAEISTTVAVKEVFPGTGVVLSFKIPDHKSGKLYVRYRHAHAAMYSSIGLNPTPLLEFSAAVGTKQITLGADVGFDTKSSSFLKCNAGIGLDTNDFSASVMLEEKGKTLKASYIHVVNPINGAAIAAEMTHNLSTYKNSFTIGSSCSLDRFTMVKARYADSGKAAMLCQHEWRPKSLITFSAEYDPKAADSAAKFGFQLHLRPMR